MNCEYNLVVIVGGIVKIRIFEDSCFSKSTIVRAIFDIFKIHLTITTRMHL